MGDVKVKIFMVQVLYNKMLEGYVVGIYVHYNKKLTE